MRKILVVEDSQFFASVVRKCIENLLGFEVVCAATYADAVKVLDNQLDQIFLALLDLNLPDAPDGEIVDYVVDRRIPVIVLTALFSEILRDSILSKDVIDYILKDSPSCLDHVVELIGRIHRNCTIKILVVDDSKTSRWQMSYLLGLHRFIVLEATSGIEALEILEAEADIRLVITDYNMPLMDGFQLTKKIRSARPKDELAVIGVSAHGNNVLSAKFMKSGANDFINKPFLSEEFFCRIYQNLDMIEHIMALKTAAAIDFLTGLNNRRQFLRLGTTLFAGAKRTGTPLTVAMLDIDFFKAVNDTYGHDGGDLVLRQVAVILKNHFRASDVVARFGGEEFCVLLVNSASEATARLFEVLRATIASHAIRVGERTIHVTVSIGVTSRAEGSLDDMISRADCLLYEAKREGRNRVKFDG